MSRMHIGDVSPGQQNFSAFDDFDFSQIPNDVLLGGSDLNNAASVEPHGSVPPRDDNADQHAGLGQASNQLVRRNQPNQLAARSSFLGGNEQTWPTLSDAQAQQSSVWPADDEEDDLDKRAAEAKREAQARRPPKQIPPFIQKLSSFLENPNYDHLIRWTQDGASFVVLDEDEFAKQLIPELFKHNNYASFVRQLNMYGFHKKVGLSDNSMRASEKKAKSPSEYSNPYFKRGRPELLWLITKPEPSKAKVKKPKSGDADADVEADDAAATSVDSGAHNGPSRKSQDLVSLPRSQLLDFQRELQEMKRQQQHINQLINHFQHENARFIQQASAQHERHENSINAILTFLATFYSRSIDGNGAFQNMFSSIPDSQRPQGNVMDMGDSEPFMNARPSNTQLVRQPRKPLALLPPPVSSINGRSDGHSERSPSTSQSPRKSPLAEAEVRNLTSYDGSASGPTPTRESRKPSEFKAARTTPPNNSDMMAAINSANAKSPSQVVDFDSALHHFERAGGNAPLTPEQRDNMLSLLASNAGSASPATMLRSLRNSDGTLPDYASQYFSNQDQLEKLQMMQRDQSQRMQQIADRLQPLSPGGIPGFSSEGSSPNIAWADPTDNAFKELINTDVFDDSLKDYGFGLDANDYNSDAAPQSNAPHERMASDIPNAAVSSTAQYNDVDGDDNFRPVGGRVVGSVATSSGAPSPRVEDEHDGKDSQHGPRKKRKLSGGR